jgi:hypothetical protein
MGDYSEMTQDDFDRILQDILRNMSAAQILGVPGVAEILMEEFNNEVLARWEQEREPEA